MSGFVNVIPNGLDVVVYVRVYVLLALFVVHASLHDMKKVRNDAAGRKTLAHVVEVESPWIGQALGEDFEFLGLGMKTPNPSVDELPFILGSSGSAHFRTGEHPMASVHPTVRTPNEAIEGFVTVMNAPAIEQNLVRTIRYVIPVGIRNEDQFGWHSDVHPAHSNGDTGTESKVLGESLFLVEHAVPIDVLEDLNAVSFVRGMSPPGLVVVILQGPEPPFEIETKGNGFPDVGLGHEGLDLESRHDFHFGNGLIRFEKGRIAGGRGRLKNGGNKKKEEGLKFHHLWKRYLFFGS